MAPKKYRLNLNKRLNTGMNTKYKKHKIPRALREAVWIHYSGKVFERKCFTPWCKNNINAFDFQTGHRIPESKGGSTAMDNLTPICCRCNLSMGNQYTFAEWCTEFCELRPAEPVKKSIWKRVIGFFSRASIKPTV